MRVALCFWGLCRSTHLTIASVEQQIFSVLRGAGIQYDVYVHTYSITRPYTNPRAGEYELQLRNTNWRYLLPAVGQVDNQDFIDKQIPFLNYRSKGNSWNFESSQAEAPWHTLDNHLRALWSLKQVTELWQLSKESYDWIVYLRPDVRFQSPFNVQWFDALMDTAIGCPDFHLISGCNDRFAICRPPIAAIYGTRFDKALAYSHQNALHAETFLADTMKAAGCRFVHLPIRFVRIRADGQPCPADAKIV